MLNHKKHLMLTNSGEPTTGWFLSLGPSQRSSVSGGSSLIMLGNNIICVANVNLTPGIFRVAKENGTIIDSARANSIGGSQWYVDGTKHFRIFNEPGSANTTDFYYVWQPVQVSAAEGANTKWGRTNVSFIKSSINAAISTGSTDTGSIKGYYRSVSGNVAIVYKDQVPGYTSVLKANASATSSGNTVYNHYYLDSGASLSDPTNFEYAKGDILDKLYNGQPESHIFIPGSIQHASIDNYIFIYRFEPTSSIQLFAGTLLTGAGRDDSPILAIACNHNKYYGWADNTNEYFFCTEGGASSIKIFRANTQDLYTSANHNITLASSIYRYGWSSHYNKIPAIDTDAPQVLLFFDELGPTSNVMGKLTLMVRNRLGGVDPPGVIIYRFNVENANNVLTCESYMEMFAKPDTMLGQYHDIQLADAKCDGNNYYILGHLQEEQRAYSGNNIMAFLTKIPVTGVANNTFNFAGLGNVVTIRSNTLQNVSITNVLSSYSVVNSNSSFWSPTSNTVGRKNSFGNLFTATDVSANTIVYTIRT